MNPKIPNKTTSLKLWLDTNSNTIAIATTLLLTTLLYFHLNYTSRKTTLSNYTQKVQLIDLKFKKLYTQEGFYPTQQKLNKINFEIAYTYEGKKYNSFSILYWENISPQLEDALDKKELEKIQVRCHKNNPNKVIVTLKR